MSTPDLNYADQFGQNSKDENFGQSLPPDSDARKNSETLQKPEPHPDLEKILQEHWEALDDVISIGPVS